MARFSFGSAGAIRKPGGVPRPPHYSYSPGSDSLIAVPPDAPMPKPTKTLRPPKNKGVRKKAKQRTPRVRPAMLAVDLRAGEDADRFVRLAAAVSGVADGTRLSARTAKLLTAGAPKMAQKVIEEAGEVAIEAVRGDVPALVAESADLVYNLVVLWTHLGIAPADVWAEMDRRETLFGMAEKVPKPSDGRSGLGD